MSYEEYQDLNNIKETITNPWYSASGEEDPNEKPTFTRSLADKIGWVQLCVPNVEACVEGSAAPVLIDPCGQDTGFYCPASFCNDTMAGQYCAIDCEVLNKPYCNEVTDITYPSNWTLPKNKTKNA